MTTTDKDDTKKIKLSTTTHCFVLMGQAGHGKTTLRQLLLDELKKSTISSLVTSTIDIVDTPGIGISIEQDRPNLKIIEEALNTSHAIITPVLVINATITRFNTSIHYALHCIQDILSRTTSMDIQQRLMVVFTFCSRPSKLSFPLTELYKLFPQPIELIFIDSDESIDNSKILQDILTR